jgi:hypothetical protein
MRAVSRERGLGVVSWAVETRDGAGMQLGHRGDWERAATACVYCSRQCRHGSRARPGAESSIRLPLSVCSIGPCHLPLLKEATRSG